MLKKILFHLIVPAVFIGLALHLMPLDRAVQFSKDEGIELMKTVLYADGFSLYSEIWNEQPPLFTALLSVWFAIVGKSLLTARLLVLGFGALLVWAFSQTLRITLGTLPALFGTLLLIFSYRLIRLSVSVMIGLPSIALAMVSVYTLLVYKQTPKRGLLVLSGALFALSVQTKLFTAYIIPILLVDLLSFCLKQRSKLKLKERVWSPIAIWLGSFTGIFLAIGVMFQSLSYERLIQPNLAKQVESAFQEETFRKVMFPIIGDDHDFFFMALVGIIMLLVTRRWSLLLPLAWFVTTLLILLMHAPVWYHYYHLFAIPVIWLAAYGIRPAFQLLNRKNWSAYIKSRQWRKALLPGFAALLIAYSFTQLPEKIAIMGRENQEALQTSRLNPRIVRLLLKYKPKTEWVFTDLPMYAFYTDLRVPPEVAVFPRKRLYSGYLTQEEILSILRTYHPEQIILGRFPEVEDALQPYLKQHYRKLYEHDSTSYYLAKDVIRSAQKR